MCVCDFFNGSSYANTKQNYLKLWEHWWQHMHMCLYLWSRHKIISISIVGTFIFALLLSISFFHSFFCSYSLLLCYFLVFFYCYLFCSFLIAWKFYDFFFLKNRRKKLFCSISITHKLSASNNKANKEENHTFYWSKNQFLFLFICNTAKLTTATNKSMNEKVNLFNYRIYFMFEHG